MFCDKLLDVTITLALQGLLAAGADVAAVDNDGLDAAAVAAAEGYPAVAAELWGGTPPSKGGPAPPSRSLTDPIPSPITPPSALPAQLARSSSFNSPASLRRLKPGAPHP